MYTRENLAKEGIKFYSDLFKARDIGDGPMCFFKLVTNGMNFWIERLPLEDEIYKVVSSQVLDKSLGLDGVNGGFFKALWPLM